MPSTTDKSYSFIVHGKPVPKGRPRMTRGGRVYTPKKTLEWEKLIQDSIDEDCPRFEGPVEVELTFESETVLCTITQMHEDTKSKLRGDLDNYIKAFLDGLQRSNLIEDDKQVLRIDALKA